MALETPSTLALYIYSTFATAFVMICLEHQVSSRKYKLERTSGMWSMLHASTHLVPQVRVEMQADEAALQRGSQAGLEHGAGGGDADDAAESLREVEHRDGGGEVRLVDGGLHGDEDGAEGHT